MIQVLYCKCGALYAACSEPDCYTDSSWLNSLPKVIENGGKIEMEEREKVKFTECDCPIIKQLYK